MLLTGIVCIEIVGKRCGHNLRAERLRKYGSNLSRHIFCGNLVIIIASLMKFYAMVCVSKYLALLIN